MSLNEEALKIIALMEQVLPNGLHSVPIEEARAISASMARARPAGPDVVRVEDRVVPGTDASIPVRIYWPEQASGLPVLVWFHGGAFAIGSIDGADATCRELCVASGAIVVSVDYRLAPEHKFPAGVEDCYAATVWTAANAVEFGIDPTRIAVGGDSAGATLAAAVTLMARDRNGPALVHQLLAYPTTLMRISSYEYVDAPIVPVSMATHFWREYVTTDSDLLSPYCAPMNATDLSGLPSAFVLVPEVDSTRADQELYAHRLAASGVLATLKVYPGTPHGFLSMTAGMQAARDAIADCGRFLRAAFA